MRRIFERTAITQHTLANIARDATGGGPLDLSDSENEKIQTGILKGLMVACDSTTFDVHIGQKENFVLGGIDEIYVSTANNLKLITDSLARAWISGDDPKTSNLYVVIHNNSPKRSGSIRVQMTNSIHKRFSK